MVRSQRLSYTILLRFPTKLHIWFSQRCIIPVSIQRKSILQLAERMATFSLKVHVQSEAISFHVSFSSPQQPRPTFLRQAPPSHWLRRDLKHQAEVGQASYGKFIPDTPQCWLVLWLNATHIGFPCAHFCSLHHLLIGVHLCFLRYPVQRFLTSDTTIVVIC